MYLYMEFAIAVAYTRSKCLDLSIHSNCYTNTKMLDLVGGLSMKGRKYSVNRGRGLQ